MKADYVVRAPEPQEPVTAGKMKKRRVSRALLFPFARSGQKTAETAAGHVKHAKRMLAFLDLSVNHEQESGRKTKHEMNNQND